MLTAFRDPATGDIYLNAGHEWVVFINTGNAYAYSAIVDETVVPDDLEVLAPLLSMRRAQPARPAPDTDLAAAAALATGPLWTEQTDAA